MEKDIIAEGIPAEEGKFCADCEHLIGVRYKTEQTENWRCSHPENIRAEKLDLVTGIKKKVFKIEDIYMIREQVIYCGPEGKWYKKYQQPEYSKQGTDKPDLDPLPVATGSKGKKKFDLDLGM